MIVLFSILLYSKSDCVC